MAAVEAQNVQKKASLIWGIADILRGAYKEHEYGEIILPMTVIKRLHDTLLPTREVVIETAKTAPEALKGAMLTSASGYAFYNTSNFTFETLLADADHIEDNFLDYLHGFSENVQDVISRFKFEEKVAELADPEVNALYEIIKKFNEPMAYFGADVVSTDEMGYVFEELTRRFSEAIGDGAGEHFTSRDIVELMTDLLVIPDAEELINDNSAKTIYDQTMGTSQMLTVMQDRLRGLNANMSVQTFGQELNPVTYAIAKADTLIRGGNPDNMQYGDTLSNDKFSGYEFDYEISNPPFGIDWKKEADAVTKEFEEQGFEGRFGAGLPKKSDGQLLFMQNALSKLKKTGRMAIVQNGSSLISGNPGGGESGIRQYLLENDYVDAIIQLPTDLFYNTSIATYIWLLSRTKSAERLGQVQLIDESNMFVKRRKNIGDKRVDISDEDRSAIVKAYGEFEEKVYLANGKELTSKIYKNDFFGFTRVTVQTPKTDEHGNVVLDNKGKPLFNKELEDTEDIPLSEDVDLYIEREVKPYNLRATLNRKKDKIGYEIPFTRLFYKYVEPESSSDIAERIQRLEEELVGNFEALSGRDVKVD